MRDRIVEKTVEDMKYCSVSRLCACHLRQIALVHLPNLPFLILFTVACGGIRGHGAALRTLF
jgi:hypothetical protein